MKARKKERTELTELEWELLLSAPHVDFSLISLEDVLEE